MPGKSTFRELFDLLPRCAHYDGVGSDMTSCRRAATRHGNWNDGGEKFCDEHSGGACDLGDASGTDLPWADIVRREEQPDGKGSS